MEVTELSCLLWCIIVVDAALSAADADADADACNCTMDGDICTADADGSDEHSDVNRIP